MSENNVPNQIYVRAHQITPSDQPKTGSRRSSVKASLTNLTVVQLNELQDQVNLFVQQISQIVEVNNEPQNGFRLDEFEVVAEITIDARGGIKLALLANAEAGTSFTTGLKFIFRCRQKHQE